MAAVYRTIEAVWKIEASRLIAAMARGAGAGIGVRRHPARSHRGMIAAAIQQAINMVEYETGVLRLQSLRGHTAL